MCTECMQILVRQEEDIGSHGQELEDPSFGNRKPVIRPLQEQHGSEQLNYLSSLNTDL